MKHLQKLILPLLIIAIIFLTYNIYFTSKGLGSFSDFDPNNTANKDIVVKMVSEKGIQKEVQNGMSTFYAVDKNGEEVLIQAPLNLPGGIEKSETITLRGHLHKGYFHAAEVF